MVRCNVHKISLVFFFPLSPKLGCPLKQLCEQQPYLLLFCPVDWTLPVIRRPSRTMLLPSRMALPSMVSLDTHTAEQRHRDDSKAFRFHLLSTGVKHNRGMGANPETPSMIADHSLLENGVFICDRCGNRAT